VLLVWASSIRRYDPHRSCIVLTTTDVPSHIEKRLLAAGLVVLHQEALEPPYRVTSRVDLHQIFFKLRAFGLSGYDKIVITDSDLIAVHGNITHLFDVPLREGQMAAVCIYPCEGCPRVDGLALINAGVMVVRPSASLFGNMMAHWTTFNNDARLPDRQEQGWLTLYLNHTGGLVKLPITFNVDATLHRMAPVDQQREIARLAALGGTPVIVHWPSRPLKRLKPWDCRCSVEPCDARGKKSAAACPHNDSHIQTWWTLAHSVLTTDGIAALERPYIRADVHRRHQRVQARDTKSGQRAA
jgi:hypothetical protein